MALKHATPMLDELEKGPWPSFVSDVKRMAAKGNRMCEDWLGLMEMSFKDKEGHWKHGGIVGVFGYGGGVIGRYCDRPDLFPNVAHFHTVRVNQPASKFYNTESSAPGCAISGISQRKRPHQHARLHRATSFCSARRPISSSPSSTT